VVKYPSDKFKQLTDVFRSVGQAPYNILTLFGGVNLIYGAYGGTPNYECDMSSAKCQSSTNTVIFAEVTEAVA
jgi:hypothetical protein